VPIKIKEEIMFFTLKGAFTMNCAVFFDFTPGTADVRTLPNGDPGYPGDPPEVEILHVFPMHEGKIYNVPLDLSDKQEEDLSEWIVENYNPDFGPEAA
jgi:hypothetical protein